MQTKNVFYTFIMAPTASSRFYKIVIHYKHLYAAILATIVSLAVMGAMSVWAIRRGAQLVRLSHVQKENQTLKEQYLSQLSHLQSRVAFLEAESDHVRQMAEEIGLEIENNSAWEPHTKAGTGGPEELESFADDIARIESKLTQLRAHLEKEKVRLATTPMGWPVGGRVTDRFGIRRNPFGGGWEFHSGIDFEASLGEPVRATADGTVVYAAYRSGYGNLVIIDHGNGITTFYGHLSTISVSVGDAITRGQKVGRAGSTGRSTGYHVHYEIRLDDRPVNPIAFAGG